MTDTLNQAPATDAAMTSLATQPGSIEPAGLADTSQIATAGAAELEPLGGVLERAGSLLEIGGPVVVVLLLMSFVALTIIVVKLLQFQWLRIGRRRPATAALRYWQAGQPELALKQLAACQDPTSQVIARAIHGQRSGLPEALVREEVQRHGCAMLFELRRGLRPLEVIGSLAPLLGLLGTVLGMIEAFRQLEAAGNRVNPAILSGGIWEALLTTAVGLCVAIPVVALLNWLERRVDRLAHDMDNLVTQVFTTDLSIEVTSPRPAAVDVPPSSRRPDVSRDADARNFQTI